MQVCSGLPISQGLAAGKIVFLGAQKAAVRQAVSPQEEQLRFKSAQRQAVDALGALYEKARAELGEKEAEIFSVHQLMAEDEDFTDLVSEAIGGRRGGRRGCPAGGGAVRSHVFRHGRRLYA